MINVINREKNYVSMSDIINFLHDDCEIIDKSDNLML